MYQRIDRGSPQARGYEITSKLSREEAKMLVNELETAIATSGKIRVLFHLKAPPYGDFGAVWEDLKFDVKYLRDLERVAVVGENALEKAAVKVFGAITPVQARYFGHSQIDQAWAWLND